MKFDLPLILASQSPRRRELLEQAGYEFEVILPSPGAECGKCSGESPVDLVARLAMQKAKDVAIRTEEGIVIGCDTVAECMGQILGKPEHRDHAAEMLRLMSGRMHHVFSGLCIWKRPGDEPVIRVDATRLRMDELSVDSIESYLDTDLWVGKAGGFGFQDGLDWVHIEDGSVSNVVGLPMELLDEMLREMFPAEF